MRGHILTSLIVLLLVVGCDRSPYQGFKHVGDEVYIRLHFLGDGERRVSDQDSVLLRIRAAHLGEEPGSYLSTERWYAARSIKVGALAKALTNIREGDSISVIALDRSIAWHSIVDRQMDIVDDTTHIQMELSVLNVHTPAMIKAASDQHRKNDPEGYERKLIAAFKELRPNEWKRWGSAEMYFALEGEVVDSTKLGPGDLITISYQGMRVEDGTVFDDTQRNGGPMSFQIGDKDQVVKGLEIAIMLLREGQSGEFILPSELAFGSKGIPGVLEPFMPVKYRVKLEHVARGSS